MSSKASRKIVLFSAAIATLPVIPHAVALTAMQSAAEPANEDIVVTGMRLGAVKVDYRLKGAAVTYCGPRDAKQDVDSVSRICGLVRDCVFGGARSLPGISACVDEKLRL